MKRFIISAFIAICSVSSAEALTFWDGKLNIASMSGAGCKATFPNGVLDAMFRPANVGGNDATSYLVVSDPANLVMATHSWTSSVNPTYQGTVVWRDGKGYAVTGQIKNMTATPPLPATPGSLFLTATITNFLGWTGCTANVQGSFLKLLCSSLSTCENF